MNTTDILDNGELTIFIENLRLAGYDIGTTEFLRAQDLLVALAAQGKLPKQLAAMKTLLMPILCHSPKEQEDFDGHFANWANKFENIKRPGPEPLTVLQWVWQFIIKNFLKVFLPIGLLVFILFIVLAVFPEQIAKLINNSPTTTPPQTTEIDPITKAPITAPTPTPEIEPNSPDNEIKQIDNENSIDDQPYEFTWWQRIFFVTVLAFLFGVLWFFYKLLKYLWQRYQAQPYLTRKSTSQPPNIKQFFAKNIKEGLFQSVGLTRVAQQLRKHTPIATDSLDLKATIKRTIKAGGWFTPVTSYTQMIPEYLVLIDRTTFKDHQSHFIDALINQLMAQGVFVARYYFDGDPRHCYPENDELPPVLLTELADQYPTHRLLMFAESNDFIDPITGDSVPWIEQFSIWPQKTFFTSEPPGQWGYPEKLLEQANFLIRTVPINEHDLTTLAEQIKAEIGPLDNVNSKPKNFSHFPAYFNEFSHWWLERHAPAHPKITELLKQVRAFLGEDGYYWFSACAVYPELRWHLTLYLGYNLKTTEGNPLLSKDNPNHAHLAKLASLPWFRYGYMPNWLREQLIKDLSLPQEDEIRAQLKKSLDKASEKAISDFQLDIAIPSKKTFSIKDIFSAVRQRFSSEWKKQAPKNSLRDYVFLTFMENRWTVKAPKIAKMLVSKISLQPLFNLISKVTNRCQSFIISWTINLSKTFKQFIQEIDWLDLLKYTLEIVLLLITFALIVIIMSFSKSSWLEVYNLLIVLGLLSINVVILFFIIIVLLSREPRFHEFWQSKSFTRRLFINQCIGLSFLSLIIVLTPSISSLINLENGAMGFAMEIYSGNIPPRREKFPPFVLLDIDDETYKNWGQPPLTPRDKLRNLINAAVQAKARLIVVLIDLRHTINRESSPLHSNDQVLYDYLVEYGNKCKVMKGSSCPSIILSRYIYDYENEKNVGIERIGFLDSAIEQAKPYVQWASTLVLSDYRIARYTLHWIPTCTEGQPGVLASAELLAASIIQGETNIDKALAPFKPKDCDNAYVSPNLAENINIGGLSIKPMNRKRIFYRIPWLIEGEPPTSPYTVYDNSNIPIIKSFSAQSYAESPPLANLNTLQDSIVVIGSSIGNCVFSTPLGEMSGSLIFANSLYSLLQEKYIQPLSLSIWLILMSVVITLMTFLMTYRIITLITINVMFLGFAYYSIILFESGSGIWINFPLLVIVMTMLWILKSKMSYLLRMVEKGNFLFRR